ncbi:MAG: winged helix-turn-helix domain-containing protein [Candidatus Acidiferrum sp.]|jgi:DNA-binding winged helix-turn-helix (wHTH) protein
MEPDAAATGASRMLELPSRYIRFGPFQVDQQRQEVTRNGSRLRLQGKVYQVLIALIEKQGEVLTREELRLRLWPNETHVNYDANVNTTVNKLRQALGDSSDKPIYIETVPRKGYCLVVQPEFADAPAPPSAAPNGVDGKVRGVEGVFQKPEKDVMSSRSDLWITIGVIALIVAGMLLGAGITRLWMGHFSQVPIAPWP